MDTLTKYPEGVHTGTLGMWCRNASCIGNYGQSPLVLPLNRRYYDEHDQKEEENGKISDHPVVLVVLTF